MTVIDQRPDYARSPALDHVAVGPKASVLARIVDAPINLAIWERRLAPRFTDALDAANLASFPRSEALGTPEAIGVRLGRDLPRSGLRQRLAADLASDAVDLATAFATIMASDRVVLRLERITGDACKRFHADYMSVRLITTYRGPGTEWLGQCDGSRVAEGRASDDAVVHRLEARAVAMMKGRLWAPERPLVHRSPPPPAAAIVSCWLSTCPTNVTTKP